MFDTCTSFSACMRANKALPEELAAIPYRREFEIQ